MNRNPDQSQGNDEGRPSPPPVVAAIRPVKVASSGFKGRRLIRGVALATIPIAAVAVAWWATRRADPSAAAGGDGHESMGVVADSARPVALMADEARRIGVTFAPVVSSDVPRQIRTMGRVTFDETRLTTFAAKVDGWVERLYVNYTGRPVRRGDALFALYSPMLVTAQEELLLANRLVRDVSAGSTDTRAGAEDLVASARRRLAYWDVPASEIARFERTGQVQRTITLRATASGVVVEKNVTEGQRIMAGEALFRVADLSTVWVDGDVYEQDLRAVREGQSAMAEFDAYPGESWSGRIAYVYPTLSLETRTARFRVALANPGLRLKPGMYATLHIEGEGRAATLSVPRSAILATGERKLVFVRRADGRLEPRVVDVGATSDDRAEILRGLSIGDTVVASATFLIDAESNLGAALGGMGDMPGMEITLPPTRGAEKPRTPAPGAPPASQSMPGMKMPAAPPAAGAAKRPAPKPPAPSDARPGAAAAAGLDGRDPDGAR